MPTFPTRLVALAVLVLAAGACRSAPRLASELPRTEHTVLIEVPPHAQDELYECGLASVASLCAHYGVEIPAEERRELARRAQEGEGLTGIELRDTLRRIGLDAYLVRGTLDRGTTGLYRHVDAGRPTLVLLAHDGETGHYCLFTGYDELADAVYLEDPELGALRLAKRDFVQLWEGARWFTLIAAPADENVPGGLSLSTYR
jgi:ABC-type bacteriocin/lantibiotic exporter with double-glycine peptidase domain